MITFDDVPTIDEFRDYTLDCLSRGIFNSDAMRRSFALELGVLVDHDAGPPWTETASGNFKNLHAHALVMLQRPNQQEPALVRKIRENEYALIDGADGPPEKPRGYFSEGSPRDVRETRRERNPKARAACISHYKSNCYACEMSFETTYGADMKDFIHVHHLRPLATAEAERIVDPIKDLRPVCPNCHAVIHSRTPILTIEEVKLRLAKAKE